MRPFAFATAVAALLVASASGQDAVDIKLGYPKTGDRVKVTVTEKTETKTNSAPDGKATAKLELKTAQFVYTDEILAAPTNAKATRLKRTYDKAIGGGIGKAAPLGIEGKVLLIEKSGPAYKFSEEGAKAKLDAESLAVLDAEFNKPIRNVAPLFPPKAKSGDGWDINRDKLVSALSVKGGPQLDKAKAAGTGKFPLIELVGDKRFGKVEVEATIPVTGLGDKSPLKVTSGKFTFTYKGDLCVDGTSPQADIVITTKLDVTGTRDGQEEKVLTTTTETRKVVLLPPEKKK